MMEGADEIVRAHDVVRVHANAMAAHGGPFDVTLDFGYRVEPTDDPEIQARVTMSWEHVKSVVKALSDMVDGYEEQIGSIPDLTQLREEET